jgi:hypothetical protein
MDYQELIRSITELSKKDIQAITFKKGSKDFTWTIKLAAKCEQWQELIKKIVYINSRLKQISGDESEAVGILTDLSYGENDKIVVIELNKYAGGNFGWEVKVSFEDMMSVELIRGCNTKLQEIFQ